MTIEEFEIRKQKYKDYQHHPLKNQYEEEKEKVIKSINSTKKYKRLRLIRLVMIILIAVYLWALNYFFGSDACVAIVVAGIANLVGIYFISKYKSSCVKKMPEYVEFIEKYNKLGLREFNKSDAAKGGCIAVDGYNFRCVVTGELLKDEKLEQCRKNGAYKCEVFERTLDDC